MLACYYLGTWESQYNACHPQRSKFGSKWAIYLPRVAFEFDGWPWSSKGRLFYATSSFVHHSMAIDELKLTLQSGNAQLGSTSEFFVPLTLKFDVCPKNNRAPLSCNINLRASIHGHWWIETYVTVRKRPTVFKICNFLSRVTLQFDGWHRKNIRAHFLCHCKLCASFHSHVRNQTTVTVRKRPNWDRTCLELCDLTLWAMTLTFCMGITFVNGDISWNYYDDTMTGPLWKWCIIWTDGRREVFLELYGRS